MGIRETINEKQGLTTAVTVALILMVVGYIVFTIARGGPGGAGAPVPAQSFYSDDDGVTWFADADSKVPPFDRNGKPAVRARVYKCGGKTFVNHLERYTPEVKKKLDAARAANPDAAPPEATAGIEVKSPGAGDWVKINDPRAGKILAPKCPEGASDLEIVTPS